MHKKGEQKKERANSTRKAEISSIHFGLIGTKLSEIIEYRWLPDVTCDQIKLEDAIKKR